MKISNLFIVISVFLFTCGFFFLNNTDKEEIAIASGVLCLFLSVVCEIFKWMIEN
jgi:hypothetical protein